MKKLVLVSVVAVIASSATAKEPDSALQVASDLAQHWVAANNSGDAKSMALLFTADATFSPATAALYKGRAAVGAAIADRMKKGFTQ